MAGISFDSVRKSYEGHTNAVEAFSLEVHDGEFIVVVGPSGCGKSTVLRMLAGLEEVTEGTIAIGGRIVNEVAPMDRDLAMVFQNYALYPHMSVHKNMAFALKMRGVDRLEIERRVHETARVLGIEELLEHGWRWGVRWCASPRPSCSMSPCRTWMRSCGWGCGLNSRPCTCGCGPPAST
jgi:multiple sugar transport system ATP-binding protein